MNEDPIHGPQAFQVFFLSIRAQGPLEVASDSGSPIPGDEPLALVEKNGVLVLAGPLRAVIPDHRQLRDEDLDRLLRGAS